MLVCQRTRTKYGERKKRACEFDAEERARARRRERDHSTSAKRQRDASGAEAGLQYAPVCSQDNRTLGLRKKRVEGRHEVRVLLEYFISLIEENQVKRLRRRRIIRSNGIGLCNKQRGVGEEERRTKGGWGAACAGDVRASVETGGWGAIVSTLWADIVEGVGSCRAKTND